jgi:hypothetical protein
MWCIPVLTGPGRVITGPRRVITGPETETSPLGPITYRTWPIVAACRTRPEATLSVRSSILSALGTPRGPTGPIARSAPLALRRAALLEAARPRIRGTRAETAGPRPTRPWAAKATGARATRPKTARPWATLPEAAGARTTKAARTRAARPLSVTALTGSEATRPGPTRAARSRTAKSTRPGPTMPETTRPRAARPESTLRSILIELVAAGSRRKSTRAAWAAGPWPEPAWASGTRPKAGARSKSTRAAGPWPEPAWTAGARPKSAGARPKSGPSPAESRAAVWRAVSRTALPATALRESFFAGVSATRLVVMIRQCSVRSVLGMWKRSGRSGSPPEPVRESGAAPTLSVASIFDQDPLLGQFDPKAIGCGPVLGRTGGGASLHEGGQFGLKGFINGPNT